MRGRTPKQPNFFYALNIEDRIRPDHPLRALKIMVDGDLAAMSRRFNQAYSDIGRPSIPPERLLKALLLMALYSLRSERQLAERIDTDLLFRWFLDMDPAEDAFDATAFTHNRKRLDDHGLTALFFEGTVKRARKAGLVSEDHFSVDGTLMESWASIKSFVPKEQPQEQPQGLAKDQDQKDQNDKHNQKDTRDKSGKEGKNKDSNSFKPRNPEVNFHGQKHSNATHASTTDPEARLFKKGRGQPARLSHMGHIVGENRHGLALAVRVTCATGTAEREAALDMLDSLQKKHGLVPKTLGADKGYDDGDFIQEIESRAIIPHVAVRGDGPAIPPQLQRQSAAQARRRAFDRMKTKAYAISQKVRKKSEEIIGWVKVIGGLARTKLVGHWKIQQRLEMNAAAYNLLRIAKLLRQA